MICQRCNRLLLNRSITSPYFRAFTTAAARSKPESPPPATSTSAAQPFSTPFTPSPSKTPGISPNDKLVHVKNVPRSSVPAGAPLRGLGYIKGQEAPLARGDDEYPSWLWGLLSIRTEDSGSSGSMGDAFAKSKKQRRLAAKAERARLTGLNASNQFAQVPLEEQSIDLPAGTSIEEGEKALEAREELNAAMRKARRKKIKENNFLRGMR